MIMPLNLSPQDYVLLTQLEEGMWQAITRFDMKFQEEAFASDFFEFGRSGRIYSREQAIHNTPQSIHAELPLADFSIRPLDENTVQITYNSAVTYDAVVEYARRSSIWSRTHHGWVMRFHQGTPYIPTT
jgi:hypothetical protein